MFRVLSPDEQTRLIIQNFSHINPKETIRRLYSLIRNPEVGETTLVKLAELFDPMGEHMVKILNYDHSMASSNLAPPSSSTLLRSSSAEIFNASIKGVVLSYHVRNQNLHPFSLSEPLPTEEYIEFFLTILLYIIFRRKPVKKGTEGKSALDEAFENGPTEKTNTVKTMSDSISSRETTAKTLETSKSSQQEDLEKQNEMGLRSIVSIESRRQEKKVTSVSCGWNHTCVITDTNEVYSWGRNAYGSLGHGDVKVMMMPKRIEAFRGKKITSVSCGGDHTFAIEDFGKAVYSFGSSIFGQLGHGDKSPQFLPRLLQTLPKTKKIIQVSFPTGMRMVYSTKNQVACGYNHTALLSETGELYTCGSGEHGELGHGSKRECSLPLHVESITAGKDKIKHPQARMKSY